MDLWIRSQDKENIVKIDRLDINDNTIVANMKKFYSGCDYIILGEYNSNRRALEVLDEIQSIIQAKYAASFNYEKAFNGFKEEDTKYMLKQMAIYEMPEK